MKLARLYALALLAISAASAQNPAMPVSVGTFTQQLSEQWIFGDDRDDARDLLLLDGKVYAATRAGVHVYSDNAWSRIDAYGIESADLLYVHPFAHRGDPGDARPPYAVSNGGRYTTAPGVPNPVMFPEELREPGVINRVVRNENIVYVATDRGLYTGTGPDSLTLDRDLAQLPNYRPEIRDLAFVSAGSNRPDHLYVAGAGGLYEWNNERHWQRVLPQSGERSWAVKDLRAIDIDRAGNRWFASPQGVGIPVAERYLFNGRDGLPFNDFTCMVAREDGTAWYGTTRGAIFFDGKDFRYRQGRRWLPNDYVTDIEVDADGNAWIATQGGIGVIRSVPMTLEQKAKFYEDEIDKYHRRTPYEFVLDVTLPAPGVKEDVRQHDSDNDGLWTCMYGAGECFAYAATGDPKAKERATKAFEAMRFLGAVTQGAEHSPPPGYVARTVLPASGSDPNIGRIERDREEQKGDKLWKAYEPRWPKSADGQWYFKTDTSSDELDGHYFLYGLYFDLVAETEEEKSRVREQTRALTDHIVSHGFNLVDVDGTATRWARFSPEEMNYDHDWFAERGLNSLSMLSYLYTTAHITGDDNYRDIAQELIDEHSYAQNIMYPKFQRGVGTGNQSDDEMAFMGYYNLLKYADNEDLLNRARQSWFHYWKIEQPELNPFFNFAFASQCMDAMYHDAWGTRPVQPTGTWLEESIDTLKRFPLDRIDWAHENSHRLDIEALPDWSVAFDDRRPRGRGMRVNGRVLPVDERHFSHWNTDPFRLDQGGQGRSLSDGAVFLLPYYMGLYHGFIKE